MIRDYERDYTPSSVFRASSEIILRLTKNSCNLASMVKRHYHALMPIHLVANHPRALALNSAGYGMLMRLVGHYWLTECHPLPTTDHQLLVLARAHKPTWYQERETIKAILEDLKPQFERAYERRLEMRDNLSRLRDRNASVRRLERAARKANAATDPAPVVQPKRKQANREPAIKPSIDSGWQD
jgi:hypothetical protein